MVKRGDDDLPEDYERLGATTVRLMMALPNWSNKKLAEETGYDPKMIALWVRAQRDPKPEQLEAIAKAIGGFSREWYEDMARTAIRFRALRRRHGQPLGFHGVADEASRRVAALVAASFPEIEALIEDEAELDSNDTGPGQASGGIGRATSEPA